MVRRAAGSGGRRIVPGVAALVVMRHRRTDSAFCMRPLGKPCRWCRNIAALVAGQPVAMTGDEIYDALCADEYLTRTCRDLLHDESVYNVRADTLERVDEVENRGRQRRRPDASGGAASDPRLSLDASQAVDGGAQCVDAPSPRRAESHGRPAPRDPAATLARLTSPPSTHIQPGVPKWATSGR